MEDFINQRKLQQLAKLSSSRQVTIEDISNTEISISSAEAIEFHEQLVAKQKLIVKVFRAISTLGPDVFNFGTSVINDYNIRVSLTSTGHQFKKFPLTLDEVTSLESDQLIFLERIFI